MGMEFDIIIQAGQSNAEGTGLGESGKGYIPNDNVYYLTAEKYVEHTSERVIIKFADKPFNMKIGGEDNDKNTVFVPREYL